MAYCLVCQRSRENQGPRENRTYVNVATQQLQVGLTSETLADYQAREPDSVYFDPANNEFLIEILESLFQDIQNGSFPLFYDGFNNLPYWQQQNATTGAALSLGSYADPEDSSSTFTEGTALEDDRFVLKVYDKDPVADGSAVHLASEEFFENKNDTSVERFLRLFNKDEDPINRNAANDRLFINGYWLDLDWGSSDNLSAGVARIFISQEFTADTSFDSDSGYRIVGPNQETNYQWIVYTKTLRAIQIS